MIIEPEKIAFTQIAEGRSFFLLFRLKRFHQQIEQLLEFFADALLVLAFIDQIDDQNATVVSIKVFKMSEEPE